MQVEPNGVVHLLENIPLNNTYQHTIRFADTTAQYNWFYSKRAHTLNKMAYQRAESGIMRVQKSVDEVYQCNYLMFQNTGFASKWFYAFITGVEYINPTTTEITYEIDVMQTWFVDCELKQCFIERSHTATDNIGDNLVPEDVTPGEFKVSALYDLFPTDTTNAMAVVTSSWKIVVYGACEYFPESDEWLPTFTFKPYGKLVSGLRYNVFSLSETAKIETLIAAIGDDSAEESALVKAARGIVGIFLMPSLCDNRGNIQSEQGFTAPAITSSFMFDGHANDIKNKKLFTFPYCCYELVSTQGDRAQLRAEFWPFRGLTASGSTSGNPTLAVFPIGYAGPTASVDTTRAVYLSDMPFIGFAADTYKNYLALNRNQIGVQYAQQAVSAIGSAARMVGGIASGDVAGAISGGSSFAGNLLGPAMQMAKEADLRGQVEVRSTGKGSDALYAFSQLTVYCKMLSIPWVTAKRIDDFFSTFGYAVNDVGTPNISSRPYWNYIKLSNPTITGPAPAQAISNIANILTNGITFWHNGDNVGDYSLDNSV